MRTGLFFGTFNPVHRGHEALASSFLSSGRISELQLVLTPSPPHKNSEGLASLEDRRTMLALAFSEMQEVRITVPEADLPPPHYTVKTLAHIASKQPDRQFVLCIGGDTLQTFSKWRRYQEIGRMVELLVAERPGVSQEIPQELASFIIHFCEHRAVDISSSHIRKEISAGHPPPAGDLQPGVESYIQEKGLYRSGSQT